MRSMTIAVVCDVPVNEKNGTAVATMNLVNGLKARGHTVRVVCPDEKMRGQPGYYVVPSINFGPLNRYVRKNGVVIARPDKATMRQALEGVDAVHVIIPFFLAYCAIHIAQELGIPVTAGFHCQAENLSNHLFLMNARAVNRLVYKIFRSSFVVFLFAANQFRSIDYNPFPSFLFPFVYCFKLLLRKLNKAQRTRKRTTGSSNSVINLMCFRNRLLKFEINEIVSP